MKSNLIITLSLLAFCLCFQTACWIEEDPPLPAEELDVQLNSSASSNPYLGTVGETLTFTFTAAIPDLFDSFKIVERKNNAETIIFEATRQMDASFEDDDFFEHEFEYQLLEAGVEVTILCILIDQAGNDVSKEWKLQTQ